MLGSLKLLSLIAGFGLLVGVATLPLRAADAAPAKETGTVSGFVADANGKAVAGAQIGLVDRSQLPAKGEKKKTAADDAKGDKPARPEPVAKAETDSEGKFTISSVPVGDYVVIARLKGVGNARGEVTVTADKDAHVELTLQARGEKKAK